MGLDRRDLIGSDISAYSLAFCIPMAPNNALLDVLGISNLAVGNSP